MNRYQQQIILPDFGREAQQRLNQSNVLLVGLGGLGCPCAQYLCAAGVGRLILCDGDTITLQNLHRQILYSEKDIGKKKVVVAKERLQQLNVEVDIIAHDFFVDEDKIMELVTLCDIVVDCTDNYTTRYILSDAAMQHHKPYVFAANDRYEGQLAIFYSDKIENGLRKVFPPSNTEPENCSLRGSLGAVLGILGSMQALETIKFLTQHSSALYNEFVQINFQEYALQKFSFGEKKDWKFDYHKHELEPEEFEAKLNNPNVLIIDVRTPNEFPLVSFPHKLIPMNILEQEAKSLPNDKELVLFCHSGIRSADALDILEHEFNLKNTSHLKGGLVRYFDYKEKIRS